MLQKQKTFTVQWGFILLLIFSLDLSAQELLKDVFKGYFFIGAALNRQQIYEKDERSLQIIKNQFNTISPENVLKWEAVHPKPEKYDFEAADRFVVLGEKTGMLTIGHTLVWHNQTPDWVFRNETGNLVTREELLKRLRSHIKTVVGRYKGKIKGWDVVNEALNEDGTLRQSLWLKIIGEDFISKAFQYAHEADPVAELYYNDYSLENEPKRKGAIALIKRLQSDGITVHAVGLQGHNNLTFPSISQQEETITEFAKLGVKINISELDVSVLPDPKGFSGAEITNNFALKKEFDPYPQGLPEEIQQIQATRYANLFDIFLKYHKNIDRITFWNVTDGDSWLNNFPVRGRTNYPLLFDRLGKPKPSFYSVINLLKGSNNVRN